MQSMRSLAERARAAARELARAGAEQKNAALAEMAKALRADAAAIVKANKKDLADARAQKKTTAFLDRLELNDERIEGLARAVEEVVKLADPIGEIVEGWTRPNGLRIEKVRLPLGVVLMIYESRPNVTSDAGALCLKSGNAAILRGGKESLASNQAIA